MPALHLTTASHVLTHAGLSPDKIGLPPVDPKVSLPWALATPTADATAPIEQTRFYRSVSDDLNDDGKRASFATLLVGLNASLACQNYQSSLKETSIKVKEAHKLKFKNAQHILWELKHGKGTSNYRIFDLTLP